MESSNANSVVMDLESRLRGLLDAERAPIMGPCLESIRHLEPELLEHRVLTAIRRNLRSSDDSVRRLLNFLRQLPAISVLLFTCQVNESYNSENDYAVHRAIEELIGASTPLNGAERKRVWQEFHYACYRIGLKTTSRDSGQGYMIEEFLHQAGLPLSFVERVTEQMIRTAGEVGLPEEDDPDGLARWQERLLWHSRFLNPTARRALEADETFYYSRTFLRASIAGGSLASEKTAVGIMVRVLAETPIAKVRSGLRRLLRIPRLLWRGDELVVEIPAGDSQEWNVAVDGREYTYRGEIAAETVPVMAGHALTHLPRTVTVTSDDFQREYLLWEDEADNRFLIFNTDGQWLKASALGVDPVSLSPGNYSMLLRFEPSSVDQECRQVSYDPDLFVLPVTLEPGQEYLLRRGPAEVCLKAEQKSWMLFHGDRVIAFSGEEVFHGNRLFLDLVLGDRQDTSLMQREEGPAGPRHYELRFEAGGLEIARIPGNDGTAEVGEMLQKLPPGLHRLVAELCPAGTARPIVRTAILYWAGLDRQGSDGVLHFSHWPENLEALGCENSSVNKDALTLGPRDSRHPTFRTEFNTIHGRRIGLDWLVPGVYLELADYSVSPVLRRRLDAGTSLAASPLSRQVLQIRSTETGRLLLDGKEFRQIRANQSISVNLSGLAERLDTGSGILQFVGDQGQLTNLARVVAPHQILEFSQSIVHGQCRVEMRFALPCTQVRCNAENVLTGYTIELSALCDDPNGWAETNMLRLESREADKNGFRYLLTAETGDLSTGAWYFVFEVCLADRWGAPTNARQDTFAFGILMRDRGFPVVSLETVLGCCIGPDHTDALLDLFTGLNAKLQRCFAPECWVSLSWLKALWEFWLSDMDPLDAQKTSQLVRLCGTVPPANASLSWLPTQRVEAAIPHLFAQQAKRYSSIYHSGTGLGCCLSAIARLERPLTRFPQELVDPFVAFGFGLDRMIAGAAPTTFDFETYRQDLLNSPLPSSVPPDWLPNDGEFLGRSHYQVCWERMRDRYRETVSGNDARRQYGMRLCREIERKERAHALCLRRLERRFDEGESVEDALLCAIEGFLSALAKKCREDARWPSVLFKYQEDLQAMLRMGVDSFPLTQVLSLVLQLGGDLFGFYLLLWEIVLAGTANCKEGAIHG